MIDVNTITSSNWNGFSGDGGWKDSKLKIHPAKEHFDMQVKLPDRPHCYLLSHFTTDVDDWLISLVRQYDPLTTPARRLLRLEIETGDTTLVWVVGQSLLYRWQNRKKGKNAKQSESACPASLSADASSGWDQAPWDCSQHYKIIIKFLFWCTLKLKSKKSNKAF